MALLWNLVLQNSVLRQSKQKRNSPCTISTLWKFTHSHSFALHQKQNPGRTVSELVITSSTKTAGYTTEELGNLKSVWCANSVFSTEVWPPSQKNPAWEQSMWAWTQMLQSSSYAFIFYLEQEHVLLMTTSKHVQQSLTGNEQLKELSKWERGFL